MKMEEEESISPTTSKLAPRQERRAALALSDLSRHPSHSGRMTLGLSILLRSSWLLYFRKQKTDPSSAFLKTLFQTSSLDEFLPDTTYHGAVWRGGACFFLGGEGEGLH